MIIIEIRRCEKIYSDLFFFFLPYRPAPVCTFLCMCECVMFWFRLISDSHEAAHTESFAVIKWSFSSRLWFYSSSRSAWIMSVFFYFNLSLKFLTPVRVDCVSPQVGPVCPMFSRSHLCSRFPLVCGKQTAGIHDSRWTAGCVPPPTRSHPALSCVVFTLPHRAKKERDSLWDAPMGLLGLGGSSSVSLQERSLGWTSFTQMSKSWLFGSLCHPLTKAVAQPAPQV